MSTPNLDPERLAAFLKLGETDLVEFKREWWDLTSSRGKALLSKHVLALANSLAPNESGLLIVGLEDQKAGGAVVGVSETPAQETVAQILSVHTNPVPRIRLGEIIHAGRKVSVLEVIWSEYQPHYATRDVDTDLSSDVVYIRPAGTVGRLKPAELERLLRAKEARLGKIVERSPLAAGFVELPLAGMGTRIVVRIANMTEEPITHINGFVDMILLHYPDATYRQQLTGNLTLQPGETREFDGRPSNADYYEGPGKPLNWKGFMWSAWMDLRLRLTYRGRDGILCEIVREAAIG